MDSLNKITHQHIHLSITLHPRMDTSERIQKPCQIFTRININPLVLEPLSTIPKKDLLTKAHESYRI